MIWQMENQRSLLNAELTEINKTNRILYKTEMDRCALQAKIFMLDELIAIAKIRAGKKTYRVGYVDYIDANSEAEAVEIFNHTLDHLDATDDNIEVYEVDNHHNTIR